jgi:hypothetical protein
MGFTGGSYTESFSLADVRLTGPVPRDEVVQYFSPTGLVVVAPLPEAFTASEPLSIRRRRGHPTNRIIILRELTKLRYHSQLSAAD